MGANYATINSMQLISLIGLAVVDSINPSAIAVTLYLLTSKKPVPKVLAYTAGVFTTYLTLGIMLVAGFGAIATQMGEALNNPLAYSAQLLIGCLMLSYALFGDKLKIGKSTPRKPSSQGLSALFGLGIAISVVEFATALPYLAAIAILINTPLLFIAKVGILVVYNLILVLPMLLLLVSFRLGAERWKGRIDTWQQRLNKEAREILYWVFGIIGLALIANAVEYFGWLSQ